MIRLYVLPVGEIKRIVGLVKNNAADPGWSGRPALRMVVAITGWVDSTFARRRTQGRFTSTSGTGSTFADLIRPPLRRCARGLR